MCEKEIVCVRGAKSASPVLIRMVFVVCIHTCVCVCLTARVRERERRRESVYVYERECVRERRRAPGRY